MKEFNVKIADEDFEFVTHFLEKLGAEVSEKKSIKKSSRPKTEKKIVKKTNKKIPRKIDHTFLFGKWKDFDIDPKKLRQEAW